MQPFNVLRYQLGQHYDSHYDIFEPESYGPQSSQRVRSALHRCITRLTFSAVLAQMLTSTLVLTKCLYNGGRVQSPPELVARVFHALQMATILFYLSDVEEGGDTIFPLEGRYGQERLKGTGFNYKSCEGGYRVCHESRSPSLSSAAVVVSQNLPCRVTGLIVTLKGNPSD